MRSRGQIKWQQVFPRGSPMTAWARSGLASLPAPARRLGLRCNWTHQVSHVSQEIDDEKARRPFRMRPIFVPCGWTGVFGDQV